MTCAWNQSWTPSVLPNCVATSCPQIPFPPASTNLVYKPDAKNNMTLKSGKNNLANVPRTREGPLLFLPQKLSLSLASFNPNTSQNVYSGFKIRYYRIFTWLMPLKMNACYIQYIKNYSWNHIRCSMKQLFQNFFFKREKRKEDARVCANN